MLTERTIKVLLTSQQTQSNDNAVYGAAATAGRVGEGRRSAGRGVIAVVVAALLRLAYEGLWKEETNCYCHEAEHGTVINL